MQACQEPCQEGFVRDDAGQCTPARPPPGSDRVDSRTTTDTDTGTAPVLPLVYGDPLELVNVGTVGGSKAWHMLDVVALDDEVALASGNGGLALVELASGDQRWIESYGRTYDLAWDGGLERAYLGSREEEVLVVGLSDRERPETLGSFSDWEGYHEDLAADSGRVLVAAPQTGAVLVDGQSLEPLATIPAGWAAAVGLHGDRAVVGDAAELVLYDLSDPASPRELDREAVRATARDIDFDGARVGVALGGHGVAALDVVDDDLVLRGQLELPGACYGVALDGDELWASAWSEVALVWLGEGGPVVVGTEPIDTATVGISAHGGRTVAADWFGTTVVDRVEGLAGPELVVPETAWSDRDDPPTATVRIANLGAIPLEVEPRLGTVSLDALLLEPGESESVVVTGEPGQVLSTTLELLTNDPDEPQVAVEVRTGEQSVGLPHEELELQGYVYPDTNLTPYRLSEQRGRVVFLAYFALY